MRLSSVLSEAFNGAAAFLLTATLALPGIAPRPVAPKPSPATLKQDFTRAVPSRAIGMLYGYKKICSAGIGPDDSVIVTAAHCVTEAIKGRSGDVVFWAGYVNDNGKATYIAKANVTAIAYPRELDIDQLTNDKAIDYDIAIIKLDHKLGPGVRRFSFTEDGPVKVSLSPMFNQSGYGKNHDVLTSDLQCGALDITPVNLRTACHVEHGDSGSPLYHNTAEGQPVMDGVIYATADDRTFSLATPINDNVRSAYRQVGALPQPKAGAIDIYNFNYY